MPTGSVLVRAVRLAVRNAVKPRSSPRFASGGGKSCAVAEEDEEEFLEPTRQHGRGRHRATNKGTNETETGSSAPSQGVQLQREPNSSSTPAQGDKTYCNSGEAASSGGSASSTTRAGGASSSGGGASASSALSSTSSSSSMTMTKPHDPFVPSDDMFLAFHDEDENGFKRPPRSCGHSRMSRSCGMITDSICGVEELRRSKIKKNKLHEVEDERTRGHSSFAGGANTTTSGKNNWFQTFCEVLDCCSWWTNLDKSFVILGSFFSSIVLMNSTKWIYVFCEFRYPFFVTALHSVFSYLIALAVTSGIFNKVGGSASISTKSSLSARDWTPRQTHVFTLSEQVTKILPFSVFGALSICCANVALLFLFPSFHTMLQNTTPFWTMVVMISFGSTSYNTWSYLSMIPICGGGILCGFGEVNFHLFGILLSIGCAVFRAFRVLVQSRMLCDEAEPVSSITLLLYASPWNVLLYVTTGSVVEGITPYREFFLAELPLDTYVALIFSALCAAFFNLFAFLLVSRLGPLTSVVVGNFQNIGILFSSVLIFGNKCTNLQVLGFTIMLFGMYLKQQYGMEIKQAEGPLIGTGNKGKGKQEQLLQQAASKANTNLHDETAGSTQSQQHLGRHTRTANNYKQRTTTSYKNTQQRQLDIIVENDPHSLNSSSTSSLSNNYSCTRSPGSIVPKEKDDYQHHGDHTASASSSKIPGGKAYLRSPQYQQRNKRRITGAGTSTGAGDENVEIGQLLDMEDEKSQPLLQNHQRDDLYVEQGREEPLGSSVLPPHHQRIKQHQHQNDLQDPGEGTSTTEDAEGSRTSETESSSCAATSVDVGGTLDLLQGGGNNIPPQPATTSSSSSGDTTAAKSLKFKFGRRR
ncbi:unnamed protein product [Amoebophrya sp. A120]|nr:unnamed protein product [Amoebophrya sp. A120]|eukprot:GSA120T00019528001.1